MNIRNGFVSFVIALVLVSLLSACSQENETMNVTEIESMLINKEQEKWDLFAQGNFTAVSEMYADDFINVGFTPAGMVRQNKEDALAMLSQVPPMPGGISLTDFLVVHGDDNSLVLSYKVSAPFGNLYVSSVWAERNGEWKTVFYQASPIFDAGPPAAATGAIPFSGLFKSVGTTKTDAALFNPDGTYALDSGATGEYGTTGHLEFNGDLVTFVDDERTDVPVCAGNNRSGTYRYTLANNGLTFTQVDDKCVERIAYFVDRTWTE